MSRNISRLKKLRKRLLAEVDSHDQSLWAQVVLDFPRGEMPDGVESVNVTCATAACAAGTTCLLAGDSFHITRDDVSYTYHWGSGTKSAVYTPVEVVTAKGKYRPIFGRARKLLGLSQREAKVFFHPDHTHEQTLDLLDSLIAGEEIDFYDFDSQDWWDD